MEPIRVKMMKARSIILANSIWINIVISVTIAKLLIVLTVINDYPVKYNNLLTNNYDCVAYGKPFKDR